MKIMRSNYDKAWRCPNWSGPGLRGGGGPCPGGSLARRWSYGRPWLRVFRCEKCGTYILPNALKWADPSWLKFVIERKVADWKDDREFRKS
jgi:hypothetical protein